MKKKCLGKKYVMPNLGHFCLQNSNNTFLEFFGLDWHAASVGEIFRLAARTLTKEAITLLKKP